MVAPLSLPLRLSSRSLLRLRGHPRIRGLHASARRAKEPKQASPLTGYYKLLLDESFTPANAAPPGAPKPAPRTPESASPANAAPAGTPHPPPSTPATEPHSPNAPKTASEEEERESRARIVFGSRLAGPQQRERAKRENGQWVAGVFVPPKPVEPDNCCMSGCVNCVLTQFVEDLDEWKKAKREAQSRLEAAQRSADDAPGEAAGGLWEGFEDIPVGLRVFMENEKKIKARKGKEAAA